MPRSFCLTIGDPSGIGPEIAVKFLRQAERTEGFDTLYVIGDIANLHQTAQQLQTTLPDGPRFDYIDVGAAECEKLPGRISFEALETAVRLIFEGNAHSLVTGPISKEHLEAAGIPFSGHTEILEHLARRLYQKPYQSDMLFVYRNFRMLLLTRHVPLRKVGESLSIKGVAQSLESLVLFLRDHAAIQQPRLCLLGVNPHAGELDGDEEQRILMPAIQQINQRHGLSVEPPKAADAVFREFDIDNLPYDAYVAAYHDQGLIPFKMVAGYQAINVTIGLPFIRTSVSHGTAPDIVGQGVADPASLIAAFSLALSLSENAVAPVSH